MHFWRRAIWGSKGSNGPFGWLEVGTGSGGPFYDSHPRLLSKAEIGHGEKAQRHCSVFGFFNFLKA